MCSGWSDGTKEGMDDEANRIINNESFQNWSRESSEWKEINQKQRKLVKSNHDEINKTPMGQT